MNEVFKEMKKGFKNFTRKIKESLNLKNLKEINKNISILILLSGFVLIINNNKFKCRKFKYIKRFRISNSCWYE